MRDKADETGSICNAPKSGRTFSVTIQENEVLVSQTFTKSSQMSKQRASLEFGNSRRSLSLLMQLFGFETLSAKIASWVFRG